MAAIAELKRARRNLSAAGRLARLRRGGATMATVSLGNHSKIVALHADQERIRAFYRDVLGCTLTKRTKNVDYIRFCDSRSDGGASL
jgi:hypothetical protein